MPGSTTVTASRRHTTVLPLLPQETDSEDPSCPRAGTEGRSTCCVCRSPSFIRSTTRAPASLLGDTPTQGRQPPGSVSVTLRQTKGALLSRREEFSLLGSVSSPSSPHSQ